MPDLGDETHLGRLERVFRGYPNVDLIVSSLVWSVWRAVKVAFEMCKIGNLDAALRTRETNA